MRILIVDDEASIRKTTAIAVQTMGHQAADAPSSPRALKLLETDAFDVCFLDVKLGAEDGLAVLERLRVVAPDMAVVMFTAYANIATAVEAMRRGAFDFIPKPFTPDQIRQVLAKIGHTRSLERRVKQLESQLSAEASDIDFTSMEPAVQRSLDIVFRAADSPASVLLLGPSGTGKSALAREVHRRSGRREEPFVTVNCPSLSRELLESDLFGHVKGAFTGAVSDAMGKVAAAEGGTLFLDEVGEIPLDLQAKLLRLLQDREYERVGEARPRRADVRVIAATNRDLAAEVKHGRFREDLFYRLNVIAVTLPALRERPADLLRLAELNLRYQAGRMGKTIEGFSPEVADAFTRYPWPGNLRELRNVIERAVILTAGKTIGVVDLPEEFSHQRDANIMVGARVTLDALEQEHIRRVLATAGSLDEAAKILGIDPATLYRKRQKMGLL